MYDSIFSSIYNSTNQTIKNLEQNNLMINDVNQVLNEVSKESYYINDMYIVFEDGTTIGDFTKTHLDIKDILPYFQKEYN
jgi:hypothetical protein